MGERFEDSVVVKSPVEPLIHLLTDQRFCNFFNLEFNAKEQRGAELFLSYSHGVTFTSWGESILISMLPVSPHETAMKVSSVCSMPLQIFDWGKNKENVKNIISYVINNISMYIQPVNPAYNMQNNCKYCCNCGRKMEINAAFCVNCGTKQ